MSVDKLLLNLGTAPAPSATDSVVLREFSGGPMAQQDAEYNFINITDRVNKLIDSTELIDSTLTASINALTTSVDNLTTLVGAGPNSFVYDDDTKTLTITSAEEGSE
jgi:hypothetical protein|tara:strand:+ start:5636 stop:5956 length:321 start_codon:yes stop_codon:yes gene_type:complete